MLEELFSNILLVAIAIMGFGFITSGKPKKNKRFFETKQGKKIYYKEDNFTQKMIKFVVTIFLLMALMNYLSV